MKHCLILICAISLLAVSSCCTKKYCMENSSVSIKFYGFTREELDTIYTTGYAPGSNFTQVIREKMLQAAWPEANNDSSFDFPAMASEILSDTKEWELYIPALNRTYRINAYSYSSHSCNNCPFDKDDKTPSLTGCRVNGIDNGAFPAKIYK